MDLHPGGADTAEGYPNSDFVGERTLRYFISQSENQYRRTKWRLQIAIWREMTGPLA